MPQILRKSAAGWELNGFDMGTAKVSWPGKDPAIHVDHRVKPGDDGLAWVVYPHFQFLNHRDSEAVRQ